MKKLNGYNFHFLYHKDRVNRNNYFYTNFCRSTNYQGDNFLPFGNYFGYTTNTVTDFAVNN